MGKLTEWHPREAAMVVCLVAARKMVLENKLDKAEALFKVALKAAENIAGNYSGLAGLVLVDLFYLYEELGRAAEAQVLWKRIITVMNRYNS
jgi:hypothetical protein